MAMKEYRARPERYESMEYTRCGVSGVLLPKVSLGLWHNFGETTLYERSREIALTAFDHGIVHFDLANNYGPQPGEAEERFGKLLRNDFSRHRDELFISTKAAYDMWEGPYGSWASHKHLMASVNQSLMRLGVEYVNLFYCHRYDPLTPIEETLQALVDIVRQGKALYIGLSRWPLDALIQGIRYLAEHDAPLLIYQGRLNMLDRAPEREGILATLGREGKGFASFSPLAQGLLTDHYLNGIPKDSRMAEERFLKSNALTPELLKKLNSLNDLAKQRGETLAQMSLAWVLQKKEVTSVLIGVSGTQQLLDDIGCLHCAPFTSEELSLIDDIIII